MRIVYGEVAAPTFTAGHMDAGDTARHGSGALLIRIKDPTGRRINYDHNDTLPFVDLKTGQLWQVKASSPMTPANAAVIVEIA